MKACSFCNRLMKEVRVMVGSPIDGDVAICDLCIIKCAGLAELLLVVPAAPQSSLDATKGDRG